MSRSMVVLLPLPVLPTKPIRAPLAIVEIEPVQYPRADRSP